jgi:hypothetical protein
MVSERVPWGRRTGSGLPGGPRAASASSPRPLAVAVAVAEHARSAVEFVDSILNCCRRATGASDGERAAFFLGPALDGPDNRAGPAHVDLSVPAQEPIRHRPKTSPIRGEAGAWSSFFFLLVRRGGQCNPNHPSPSPSPPVACRSVSAARRDGRYPFAACVGGMRRSSSSPYYRCA